MLTFLQRCQLDWIASIASGVLSSIRAHTDNTWSIEMTAKPASFSRCRDSRGSRARENGNAGNRGRRKGEAWWRGEGDAMRHDRRINESDDENDETTTTGG